MPAPTASAATATADVSANSGSKPQAFISVRPMAGASAVDMAIDSPNMPRPSPMRLGGTMSVTHVEAALLAAAWNTP